MAAGKQRVRKLLIAALFLVNALGVAAQAYVRSELPSHPPKSNRPEMIDLGQALKILKKLKADANSTLVQRDIKFLEKANKAIEEAYAAIEEKDLTKCSDWVITAKGELEKVHDGSLRIYTTILEADLKAIRLEVAALRNEGRT